MKQFIWIMFMTALLIPVFASAEIRTVQWDVSDSNVSGKLLTEAEKSAVVTVIEAGILWSDNDIKWTEVGKSDPGATTWKGTVPDNFVALRAKHGLNGMYSPWTTISAPVQPRGLVVIEKITLGHGVGDASR